MINNKKITVVMPAYNAGKTLEETYNNIPFDVVDEVLLVDDFSSDDTVKVAKSLGIKTFVHKQNLGYGANQKTCYKEALKTKADIIVMLHPDFQYDPRLIPALSSMIAYDNYDCALASRFLVQHALNSKMPKYKYIANRFLTVFQNICLGKGLSEYHTGYRAYKREVLEKIDFEKLDNNFIFDNQMLALIYKNSYSVGEISCPAKYFDAASSINFIRSTRYGFGVLWVSVQYLLSRIGLNVGIFKK